MISLDNITVSYGGWDLFSEISLLVNPRDRIGLVGKNGAGKTTLLKIITGQQATTSGVVSQSGDVTIGYLPQQMKVADTTSLVEETAKAFREVIELEAEIAGINDQLAVRTDYESASYEAILHRLSIATDRYHILGGETREADIERTLLGLGFRREDFGRPTREFSGGWRMRIELAKLLLARPSVFLLDEPTNHLDIESIQWLEGYLRDYQGAVVVISHDRAFLDNVTNRTVEISLGKLYDYKVPYSQYVTLRAERRQQQMAAYANQQRMIEKTEEFIEKFRYKPTKSNQVQSRVKQLEKLERLEVDEEDTATLAIKFPPAPRSGQIVAEVKNVGKTFPPREAGKPEKYVFSGADFAIERGEKIALVGRNGEGKTTFARMLIGELEPSEGSVRIGANVNTGYYAQNQDDLMDGNFTVFDTLDRVAVGDIRTRLRDILAAFLFRGGDIDKKVKVLSGGERARLAMARLMLEPRNLLVMDEPTNHMDMRSKDILKRALQRYDGTLVLVSHDREFLDGLVDKVYEFRDGGVREYLGGIWYFLEKRKIESLKEVERSGTTSKNAAAQGRNGGAAAEKKSAASGTINRKETASDNSTDGTQKGAAGVQKNSTVPVGAQAATSKTTDKGTEKTDGQADYRKKKESDREIRRMEKAISEIEKRIAELERQVADWDARLADPAAHGIDVADVQTFTAYNDIRAELARQMHEWEKLNYELDILTEKL